MPRFPRREAEIVAFADDIIDGLNKHKEVFSEADLGGLEKIRQDYEKRKATQQKCWDSYQEATLIKDDRLKKMITKMKGTLKEAQNQAGYRQLRLLGWGGDTTADSSSHALPPGSPRRLTSQCTEDGRVVLDWKAPSKASGGLTGHYEVWRKSADGGEWSLILTSYETDAQIKDHPKGKWEFHVVGHNRKGASKPSTPTEVTVE